jgi:hypothetical protein
MGNQQTKSNTKDNNYKLFYEFYAMDPYLQDFFIKILNNYCYLVKVYKSIDDDEYYMYFDSNIGQTSLFFKNKQELMNIVCRFEKNYTRSETYKINNHIAMFTYNFIWNKESHNNVNSLPTIRMTSQNDFESKNECPLCTEVFQNKMKLNCGHVFCYKCMNNTLASHVHICPSCKIPITDIHLTAFRGKVVSLPSMFIRF